jgi:hypothetical protein
MEIVAASAVAIVVILAYVVSRSERACADARVEAQRFAGELAIATANVETQRNRADNEQRRADALDDLLASQDVGPVAGAFARLQARRAAAGAHPADGGDARPVPAPPAATEDRDRLLGLDEL